MSRRFAMAQKGVSLLLVEPTKGEKIHLYLYHHLATNSAVWNVSLKSPNQECEDFDRSYSIDIYHIIKAGVSTLPFVPSRWQGMGQVGFCMGIKGGYNY